MSRGHPKKKKVKINDQEKKNLKKNCPAIRRQGGNNGITKKGGRRRDF